MSKHKGMNSYDEKERRRIRRRNHIAKDLRTPKYRQRVVEYKDKYDKDFDWDFEY